MERNKKYARYKKRNNNNNKNNNNYYDNNNDDNRPYYKEAKLDYKLLTKQEYEQEMKARQNRGLDNALRITNESEEIAANTMEKLYGQRKQLEKVDEMLHETDQTLKQTKHTLNGMESIVGGLKNWLFKKPPKHQSYQNNRYNKSKKNNNNGNNNNNNNNNDNINEIKVNKKLKMLKQAKYIDDNDKTQSDKEQDEKLDMILGSVKRLNVMAKEMNRELVHQNDILDDIDDKMGVVDDKLRNQQNQMKRVT